jgi:hypothetical protein
VTVTTANSRAQVPSKTAAAPADVSPISNVFSTKTEAATFADIMAGSDMYATTYVREANTPVLTVAQERTTPTILATSATLWYHTVRASAKAACKRTGDVNARR